jgi:hypothetical protein
MTNYRCLLYSSIFAVLSSMTLSAQTVSEKCDTANTVVSTSPSALVTTASPMSIGNSRVPMGEVYVLPFKLPPSSADGSIPVSQGTGEKPTLTFTQALLSAPEPSSWSLMGLGVLSFLILVHRRSGNGNP